LFGCKLDPRRKLMLPETTCDVLIAGAGPTGLFLASELARHGVRPRLIDKSPEPSRYSKALGIHARTLELFRQVGLVEPFLAQGLRAGGISQYSGRSLLLKLDTAGVDDTPYPFTLVLEQSKTEALLIDHLARQGIVPERPLELVGLTQDADGVTATLQRGDGSPETVRARYLVGCEGAHSVARHALGLPFEGAPYPIVFALADVTVHGNLPLDRVMAFHHPDGPALVFPLPGSAGRVRLVFDVTLHPPAQQGEIEHGPLASKIPPPTLEDVRRLTQERIGKDVTVGTEEWLSHFRIHIRQVPRYREGRVFLAGDAAHIHSPAGGQGMNTGLQDASNLAWKLALTLQGKATPALLDSYSSERHAIGKLILASTDRLTRLMTVRNFFLRWGRNLLLRVVNCFSGVKRGMARQLMMLDLNYRGSPLVREEGSKGTVQAGDRAPDAGIVRLPGKMPARMLDLFTGTGHHLLLFMPADRTQVFLEAWLRQGFGEFVTTHRITPEADPQGEARRRYGVSGEAVFLVRPDSYIGFVGRPADAAGVAAYLRSLVIV
jgi:2-polyprenyl-6-methoxyphenol hydroxylase-like FAD-dependent oxidoreductase